jgi:FAD/FMN-containing dehydrogenase
VVKVASWGRLGEWEHEPRFLYDRERVAGVLAACKPGLAYGMGRSYGDVCLNPGGTLWMTSALNRFIAFDPDSGVIECEAGVLLKDIQELAVPRGWMLPVTPGTWFVTVGGAIANDVHGKNHHRSGSFGDHVLGLRLCRTDGTTIDSGPEEEADWFAATVGGMGLTGVITRARIQLRRVQGPWIEAETIPYTSLAEFFDLSDASEKDWEYTVSWVDCLSGEGARGIFFRGNHAEGAPPDASARRALAVPATPPFSMVNRLSLKPANALYYHLHRWRSGRKWVDYRSFFYPLDSIRDWNRIYGPRGFYQYQCVVPPSGRDMTVAAMLDIVARAGSGSFLAVLKTFGQREAPGMLSFPRSGVTLALDFPNTGEKTLALMEQLDTVVRDAGGRLYVAKDARMPRDLFESGYPRLAEFLPYRDEGISSGLSQRLMGS